MTTLYEFLYQELDQPETVDLVGIGAADDEYRNQWLYRMNHGLSDIEGVESVEDYWLGFEEDSSMDYDITGDVFQQGFDEGVLDSEASLLVVPKPSIYRPRDDDAASYISNYEDLSELAHAEIDGVLMRQVAKDINAIPSRLEYEQIAQNFREAVRKKPEVMTEFNTDDIANMLTVQSGVSATSINWKPGQSTREEMILVKGNEEGV
jgi:hypothetical protein